MTVVVRLVCARQAHASDGINGITCPSCKVEWDDQMVDEASQEESGLGMAFYVSQDRDTESAYLFCDFR